MQASVTTVFRSAIPAGSMPISSASPARACRTTATFSDRAGRDISSPLGFSLLGVCAIDRISCRGACPQPAPSISADFKALRYPRAPGSQTLNGHGSIASVSPTPFEVSNEALDDGVLAFAVRGELDLHTAPELDRPL